MFRLVTTEFSESLPYTDNLIFTQRKTASILQIETQGEHIKWYEYVPKNEGEFRARANEIAKGYTARTIGAQVILIYTVMKEIGIPCNLKRNPSADDLVTAYWIIYRYGRICLVYMENDREKVAFHTFKPCRKNQRHDGKSRY